MGCHQLFNQYFTKDKNIKNKTVIEIGTTREIVSGQDSTRYLYNLSKEYGYNFITIDMDKENTENAQKRHPGINSITMKGEDFLETYEKKIDYIYLDAFDFWHNGHTEKRKRKYREILNCEITNKDCHEMHLKCAKYLVHKLSVDGVIIFDDILNKNWDGKGKTAIPLLLENNFCIDIFVGPGCSLVRNKIMKAGGI